MTDAHKFLLEHFEEYDFIWSSPPCPTHSKLRKNFVGTRCGAKPAYPDMKLYEEILLLQGYFRGNWVVENVIGWYKPLVRPFESERHYFWANFIILKDNITKAIKFGITDGQNKETQKQQIERLQKELGFDLSPYKINKRLALRNCVNPEVALKIFKMASKEKQISL